MQTASRPLPGPVKVFLAILYAQIIVAVLPHMLSPYYRIDSPYTAWGAILAGVAGITAILIHGRSQSAITWCQTFSGLYILSLLYYTYFAISFFLDRHEPRPVVYLVFAVLPMGIALFIAWFWYFRLSAKFYETFGLILPGTRERSALPLGKGILAVLCWMFVAGYACLITAFALGSQDAGNIAPILAWSVGPNLLFSIVTLLLLRGSKTGTGSILCVLGAWIASTACQSMYLKYMVFWNPQNNPHPQIAGPQIELVSWLDNLLLSPTALAVVLAFLGWRLATMPDEGRGVRQNAGLAAALQIENRPLLPLLLFYLGYSGLLYGVQDLAGLVFPNATIPVRPGLGTALAALFATACTSACILIRSNGVSGRKTAMLACVIALAVVAYLSLPKDGAFSPRSLARVFRLYTDVAVVALLAMAALATSPGIPRRAPGSSSPLAALFAMPVPLACLFLYLCLTGCGHGLYRLLLALADTSAGPPVAHWHVAARWLAWVVCPLAMAWSISRGLRSLKPLIALTIIWLGTGIVLEMVERPGSMPSRAFCIAAVVLPVALGYCASSVEVARWRNVRLQNATGVPDEVTPYLTGDTDQAT